MHSHRAPKALVLLAVASASAFAGTPSSGIYWSRMWNPDVNAAIVRAEFDGSNPQDIVTQGLNAPWPIAVDASTHKIYWGDVNMQFIQRANLDGSSVQNVVLGPRTLVEDPAGLAIDSQNQVLYWTDFYVGKVARTDLATGVHTTLVVSELTIVLGMDIDVDSDLMYWVEAGMNRIRRARLDGSDVQDFLTGLYNPRDVKLDLEGGKLFWVQSDGLWRVNLDATNVERLDFEESQRLAIDRLDRKLYRLRYPEGLVRSDLDGNNMETLVPYFDLSMRGFQGVAVVHDCNENFVDDYDELATNDCNENRTPDDCEPDTDGDLIPPDCDNCPSISNSDQLDCNTNFIGNACEPNPADTDDDSDGACNGVDGCPLDPNKTDPGACGCGAVDTDSDGDGVADCNDLCPGTPDVDSDADSVLDCDDQCPGTPDVDSDGDSVLDCIDQCAGGPDVDSDFDTVLDCLDQCPGQDDRLDADGDTVPDCLATPVIPTVSAWGLLVLGLLFLAIGKARSKSHAPTTC